MLKTVITVCDYGTITGGAAKVAIESALALVGVVEESILFHSVGEIDKNIEDKGVKVIALGQYDILQNPNRMSAIVQGIWNRKAKKEFEKLLSQKNPKETVIHVHSWTKALSSSIFKAAEDKGFQVVITAHDYFLACPNGGFFNYQKKSICKFKPLSIQCVCCHCDNRNYFHKWWRVVRQIVQNNVIRKKRNISYIFVSEFSQKILEKHVDFHRCYRVNNPIEIKDRIKVNAEKNDNYLYIGRLSEEKGVGRFCKVISNMGLKGIIVGDGYLMKKLKSQYPNIEFAGWQNYDGIRKYILKARCLIFPSMLYECAPLTISEVQAFGIPCIVPKQCAARDYIKEAENGNIFGDSEKLALDHILQFYKNDDYVKRLSICTYNYFNIKGNNMDFYINSVMKVYVETMRRIG